MKEEEINKLWLKVLFKSIAYAIGLLIEQNKDYYEAEAAIQAVDKIINQSKYN